MSDKRSMKKRRYIENFNDESYQPNQETYLMMSESELTNKLNNMEELFLTMMNNIKLLNNELVKIEEQIEELKQNDDESIENNFSEESSENSYFS